MEKTHKTTFPFIVKNNYFLSKYQYRKCLFADWEVTNHATEEQVARESYLQQLRDNERRHAGNSKSATVTSADLRAAGEATSPSRAKNLVEEETKEARSSLGKNHALEIYY